MRIKIQVGFQVFCNRKYFPYVTVLFSQRAEAFSRSGRSYVRGVSSPTILKLFSSGRCLRTQEAKKTNKHEGVASRM